MKTVIPQATPLYAVVKVKDQYPIGIVVAWTEAESEGDQTALRPIIACYGSYTSVASIDSSWDTMSLFATYGEACLEADRRTVDQMHRQDVRQALGEVTP